jgi:hypothetical protein
MKLTKQVYLPFIFPFFRRQLALAFTVALLAALPQYAMAVDALAYSFENDLQGFHPNGLGTTITQDTIGATQGTHSMKVSIVGGATFVGALTPTLDPSIFGDPPGLDHVHFDMTITQRFDQLNPNPPPDRIGFARIGVIVFGTTQPDFPGGQQDTQAQLANLAEDEVPVGGLEPGTYRDQRIDLDKLGDPFGAPQPKTFNEIFGTVGSGPNDIIPIGFELYFNKTGDPNFPLTVYIDNIRFGTSVPGDYNGNDVVDAADYVLWRKNPGPVPTNFNFRNEVVTVGTVEPGDYTAWRARFGNNSVTGSGLGNGKVPEPASGLLLLVAACAAACRRAHSSLAH